MAQSCSSWCWVAANRLCCDCCFIPSHPEIMERFAEHETAQHENTIDDRSNNIQG